MNSGGFTRQTHRRLARASHPVAPRPPSRSHCLPPVKLVFMTFVRALSIAAQATISLAAGVVPCARMAMTTITTAAP